MIRNILTPGGMQSFEFDDTMSAEEQEARMIESIAARAASADSNGLGTMGAVGQFLAQAQQMIRPNNVPQRTGPRVIRASSAWGLTPEQVTNSFEAISQDAARQQEMEMRRQESLANRQMQLKQLQEQARLGAEEMQTNILLKRMERQAREQEADDLFAQQKEMEKLRQQDPTRGSMVKVNVLDENGNPVRDASGNYKYRYVRDSEVGDSVYIESPTNRAFDVVNPDGSRGVAWGSPGGPPVGVRPGGVGDPMVETPEQKARVAAAERMIKHMYDSRNPDGSFINPEVIEEFGSRYAKGEDVAIPDVVPESAWRTKEAGLQKQFDNMATAARISHSRAVKAERGIANLREALTTKSDPKEKEGIQAEIEGLREELRTSNEGFVNAWSGINAALPETPGAPPLGTLTIGGKEVRIVPSANGATGKGSGEAEGENGGKKKSGLKSPADVIPNIAPTTRNVDEVWDATKGPKEINSATD